MTDSNKDTKKKILDTILESYETLGGINHLDGSNLPSRDSIIDILNLLRKILFPGFFGHGLVSKKNIEHILEIRLDELHSRLSGELFKTIKSESDSATLDDASRLCLEFASHIPKIRAALKEDIEAIFDGDPAAKDEEEIILAYPGFQAITVYRIAHFFYQKGIPLLPRLMTEISHSETGIDIHPGAKIGRRFCIDHGTGIVIGETAEIGNNVKLYQGVTLGALSVKKDTCQGKRHPTIEDNVTIYARTTILGGNTVIGENSIIGGNVWLTKSVPRGSKIYASSNQKQTHRHQVELSPDPQI